MNKARRERKRANREQGFELEPVTVPATEAQHIPHYTVQAGLASAVGCVKPDPDDEKKG